MKCPNCRCVIPNYSRVCNYCGYDLRTGSSRTVTASEAVRDKKDSAYDFYGDYRGEIDGERTYYSANRAYYGDYDVYDARGYNNYYDRKYSYNYTPTGVWNADYYADGYRDGYFDACKRKSQSSLPRRVAAGVHYAEPVYEQNQLFPPTLLMTVLLLLLAVLGLLGLAVCAVI